MNKKSKNPSPSTLHGPVKVQLLRYSPLANKINAMADRRIQLKREGKQWAICYSGMASVTGLVPDFWPMPRAGKIKLDPESIRVQIRGALVQFALEVLKSKRFVKARKTG